MDITQILSPMALLSIPVFLFALSVHEMAHALTANWGGDDTAYHQGRITLNPISHIDPIGTILIPLLAMVMGGIPLIGWARPVEVNPLRFKHSLWQVYVAIAGPISNVLQALVAALLLYITCRFFKYPEYGPIEIMGQFNIPNGIITMLYLAIPINLFLAIFNMIPLPPLDGHWVMRHFYLQPGNWLDSFYSAIMPFNYMVLMLVVFALGNPIGHLLYYVKVYTIRILII